MLDNIFDSIKDNVLSTLTEKTGITTEQAENVLPVAKDTVQKGLMDEAKSGNFDKILDLFNTKEGNLENNGLFGNLKSMLLGNIMSKVGLPESLAGLVAGDGLKSIIGNMSGFLSGDDGKVKKEDLMSKLDMGSLGNIAGGFLKGKLGDIAGGLFK